MIQGGYMFSKFIKMFSRNIKSKEDENREQCPNCGTTKYLNFSTQEYRNNFKNTLENFDICKYGRLLRCKKCFSYWFISGNNIVMEYISENHINVFNEWNKRNLFADNYILKKLMNIGATPPDIYGNLKEFVRIPCKCVTKDGQEIDFCIITFQKLPPNYYQLDEGNILFIDEVADVYESEYALSAQVRSKTSLAEEIRMCFSPTLVCAPDGKKFILNGVTNFFDGYGHKGKDITLPPDDIQLSEAECTYYDENINKRITWVIADLIDQNTYKVTYDNTDYRAIVICFNYWDYALYDLGEILIMDIVHDGVATSKSTFILDESELNNYKNFGLCYITQLVKEIQCNGIISRERNIHERFKSDLLGI